MFRCVCVSWCVMLSCASSSFGQGAFRYTVDGRRCTAFFYGNGSGSAYEVPHVPFDFYQGGAEIEAFNGIENWRAACTQTSSLELNRMSFSGAADSYANAAGGNTLNSQAASLFDVRFVCERETPYTLVGVVGESGHVNSVAEVRLTTSAGVVVQVVTSSTNTTTPFSVSGTLSAGVYVMVARAASRCVAVPGFASSGEASCTVSLMTPTPIVCMLDWNHDMTVNSADFLLFLTDFLSGDADYNGDGETSSADFFEFLAGFMGGC